MHQGLLLTEAVSISDVVFSQLWYFQKSLRNIRRHFLFKNITVFAFNCYFVSNSFTLDRVDLCVQIHWAQWTSFVCVSVSEICLELGHTHPEPKEVLCLLYCNIIWFKIILHFQFSIHQVVHFWMFGFEVQQVIKGVFLCFDFQHPCECTFFFLLLI